MKTTASFLIALAVLLASAATAAAIAPTDVFVAAAGSADGNPCTQESPCATIAHAATVVATGGTVHIGPGSYAESVSVNRAMTFTGAGSGTGPSDTQLNPPAGQAGFSMSGGGALRHLHVTGTSTGGMTSTGGSGALLSNSVPGAMTYAVDDFVAVCSGGIGPGGGVSASTNSGPVDVTVTGGSLSGTGVPLSAFGAGVRVSVRGGPVFGGPVFTAQAANGAEVDLSDLAFGGRTVLDSGGILALDRVQVISSGQSAAIDISGSATVHARDSVISSTDTSAPTSLLSAAIAVDLGSGETASVDLKGSTVYARGQGIDAAVVERVAAGGNGSVALHNTIVREEGPSGSDLLATRSGNGVASIDADYSAFMTSVAVAGATASAPGSAHNIATDPQMFNPAGGDFTLKPTSPVIEKGDPATPASGELDLAGAARVLDGDGDCTGVPDIGAFEAAAIANAACTPAPTPTPTPEQPPPVTPADHTPPVFSASLATRRRLPRKAGRLSYSLSEAATIAGRIDALLPGRRTAKGCRAAKRGKRCTRAVKRGTLRVTGHAGRGTAKVGPKFRGKRLKPGRYRLRLVATDAAGNASRRVTIKFRVKPV